MVNHIVLESINLETGNKQADSGLTVQVYNFHASDTAGNPPNGTLIGAATEIGTTGVYSISLSEAKKCTVVVGGNCRTGMIGVMLHGETALDNSIDTTAIADAAVTPAKTTFAENF